MFFSITVVSTAIRFRLLSVTAPEARAALIVLVSSHSTPSSPIRLRQRVSEDGSIGGRCWKKVSPVKCWKYGFSTQRASTASSERPWACWRYISPATRRGWVAGRPSAAGKKPAHSRSNQDQSISAASRTSSCRPSIMSTSRGRSRSACSGGRGRCFMPARFAGFVVENNRTLQIQGARSGKYSN